LAIEHEHFQQGKIMRMCYVTERRMAAPEGTSQETLNSLSTVRFYSQEKPRSLTRASLAGVTVTDAIYDGAQFEHVRWFFVVDAGEIRQIVISCGATHPVSNEVKSNIAGMLETLRIKDQP
jgi:hypothetical protein